MSVTQIAEPVTETEIDQLCINTIRTLSIDAVQQAKSGHPGTPMALAPLVYTIWNRVMHFDPQDPIWPNRDRFVLSNGHASMLLWSVLHLTKVQAVNAEYESLGRPSVTLDDVRRFRTSLENHKKSYDMHLYAGAPHGWLNDTMPGRYRKREADAAWEAQQRFLREAFAGERQATRVCWRFESEFGSDYDFSKNVRQE